MILNSIIEYSKMDNNGMINGLAVIPSNSDEIKKVLPIGKVGVMLELGNVDWLNFPQ